MTIWIQSLSWALIYAPVQGFLVYAALWLVLKLMPGLPSNAKYHLSLSALTVLLAWFITTWWQQFQLFAHEQTTMAGVQDFVTVQQQQPATAIINYSGYDIAVSFVQQAAPWLSACYLIGLSLMLVRLSGGIFQLFSLKKTGISRSDGAMHQLMTTLKNRLHIKDSVQFFISAKAKLPMVIGFIKPVVLMPAAAVTQLSTAQLESILLHELAHIKRYDYLVNILQTVAETILFFNPFAWMISAIIRREREHCCDDLVLAHTQEPIAYATALASLATYTGTASALTIAASGQSHHLFNRIKRIMEMKKTPFSYSKVAAALLIVASITCSVVWLSPSFAQPKDMPAETTNTFNSEEHLLIKRLTADGLINADKGFLVEKKLNKLFIDGKQQPDDVAAKYLSTMTRPNLSIQVFPYRYWQPQSPSMKFLPPSMFPVIGDTTVPGC